MQDEEENYQEEDFEEEEEEEEESGVTYTITYTTETKAQPKPQGWIRVCLHALWKYIQWFFIVNFAGGVASLLWNKLLVPAYHLQTIDYGESLALGGVLILIGTIILAIIARLLD